MSILIGTDGIFAAFCAQLIAQFRLLNKQLENTNQIEGTLNYIKNLEECIPYHSKLIE